MPEAEDERPSRVSSANPWPSSTSVTVNAIGSGMPTGWRVPVLPAAKGPSRDVTIRLPSQAGQPSTSRHRAKMSAGEASVMCSCSVVHMSVVLSYVCIRI